MTKTSHSQPMQRQKAAMQSIQPWLRDQYATLRTETGPRWEHARAVVVPVLADTSNRVRTELVPAAMHLSSRVTEEAMHRSAPLRSEVSGRAAATLAAARGQVSATQIEQLQRGRGRRKFWIISGAAAIGAALGTAAVLWQRSRYQAWVEDEAVQNTISDDADVDAEPERMDKPGRGRDAGSDMNRDDPSDSDADSDEQDSSAGKHRQHH